MFGKISPALNTANDITSDSLVFLIPLTLSPRRRMSELPTVTVRKHQPQTCQYSSNSNGLPLFRSNAGGSTGRGLTTRSEKVLDQGTGFSMWLLRMKTCR
eukprot:944071-Amorphochlora_amoeboformis.AAC.1